MIPCSGSEIHRWNALDDLDDDISDRVNDDLIPFDDNEYHYDDPDLVVMGSFSSSDSTVEDSEQYKNSSNEYSQVDEDGLILALDDSTNRKLRIREEKLAKARDIVTVRVKKSVKYGNKENATKPIFGMSEIDKRDIIRPTTRDSRQAIRPEINTMYSDSTMNSLTPTNDENETLAATQCSDIITVRFKKSAKYGNKENIISSKNDIVQPVSSDSRQLVRPKINTIHSDGTISSLSPTNVEDNGTIVPHSNTLVTKPKIATIYSDGSIGYKDEDENEKCNANAIVEKPVQKIATINGDGTISYRLGNEIGNNETLMITNKPSTMHSERDEKIYPKPRTGVLAPKVSFENVVTDSEDHTDEKLKGDDDDMDDDICDKIDDSRYTRSLHSMPVLQEATEEESPLHSDRTSRTNTSASSKQVKTSPTWLELQKSPSATTTMTPRRSNDRENGKEFGASDNLTSGWLGLTGFEKKQIGSKYQSMDGSKTRREPKRAASEKPTSPRSSALLQVETCSTGTRSEDGDCSEDVETGGNNVWRRGLCCAKNSSSKEYQHFTQANGNRPRKNSNNSCCFRRRDWIAALLIILIGVTVGVTTYFITSKFYGEGDNEVQNERIKEWTIEEEVPVAITTNNFDSVETVGSEEEASNSTSILPDFSVNEPKTSMAPSDASVDIDEFKTESPTLSPTMVEVLATNNGPISVVQDTVAINQVIRRARREIELLIFDDDDLIGKFLRLVFHDCIGGCDGCVDLTNPENKGLGKPIDALQPIVEQFEAQGLSRTDIWMLSSLVASELALPFLNSDMLFPLHWIGRQTCEARFADITDPVTGHCGLDYGGNPTPCSATRGPHVEQPHGFFGTNSILKFFENEFGFNPQQVTAIMGAHSVGKMARENVGFMGTWDLSTSSLDSGYWVKLVGNPPDFFVETVDNSDLPNIPNRHQWRGIVKDMEATTVVMLNADVALVRNIEDMDANGNVGCAGPGILLKDCPSDTPFLPFAKLYNSDNKQFLMDFRDVLNVLIDHGSEKPSPTTVCLEDRICVFENSDLQGGFALEELSPAPTPSPSRHDQPMVSVDRLCYDNVGDTMVVEYDNVPGTDITIEVFSAQSVITVEGRTMINPRVEAAPLKSSLSCGNTSCHTWTPRGGFQMSTENLTGGGTDYVILLSARSAADSNGELQLLAHDSFRVGRCMD